MNPSLAFITPVMPRFSGNGLAMRAAHNLRALSEKFTVHLLIIALYGESEETPPEEILRLCASWKHINTRAYFKEKVLRKLKNFVPWSATRHLPQWAAWNASSQKEVDAYLARHNCSNLWVFRFYLFPWVERKIRRGLRVWLDLDELESSTRTRQAALHTMLGHHKVSRQLRREAAAYRDREKKLLPLFHHVMTSSRLETERLQKTLPRVTTWPNIISRPILPDQPQQPQPEKTLLFVGNMGYFPNLDAARRAVEEILPRVQKRVGAPLVVFQVAGTSMAQFSAEMAGIRQVECLGTVADLGPVYARADVVVVPLRTGGGTRIKILEAMAHRKAIISTRIGAEGLEVAHERELLLANEPEEFAAACAELLLDAEKRDRVAGAGHAYVTTNYGEDNLRPQAEALAQEIAETSPD
jgi:glycosyltransferase involved in cell wall biosynthesis